MGFKKTTLIGVLEVMLELAPMHLQAVLAAINKYLQ